MLSNLDVSKIQRPLFIRIVPRGGKSNFSTAEFGMTVISAPVSSFPSSSTVKPDDGFSNLAGKTGAGGEKD